MRRSVAVQAKKRKVIVPRPRRTRPSNSTSMDMDSDTLNEVCEAEANGVSDENESTATDNETETSDSELGDVKDDRIWSEKQLIGEIDEDDLAAKVLAIRSSTEFIKETKSISDAVKGNSTADLNVDGVALKNALETMYTAVKDKYDLRVKGSLLSLWADAQPTPKEEPEKDTSSNDLGNRNGHWPTSLQKVNPTGRVAKTTVTKASGEKVVLTTPIIQMEAVEAMPTYNCWDEVTSNVKAPDSKYLTNIPYIPTLFEGRKEKQFVNQLLKTFKNKVHAERNTIELDHTAYFELVILMMTALDPKPTNSAESDSPGKEEQENPNLYPTYSVFSVLAKELELTDSPVQLAHRYIRDCKKIFPVKQSRAPEFCMVDETFCERCMLYSCLLHDEDDIMPGRRDYVEESDSELEEVKPCKNEDCIRKCPPTKETVQAEGTSSEWTETEARLFKGLIRGFKGSHCAVAQFMPTKNCRQLYEYDQKEKVVLAENMGAMGFKMKQKKKQGSTGKQTLWLRNFKKNFEGAVEEAGAKIRYMPCYHPGYDCEDILHCQCYYSKTGCDKFCGCSINCPSRFPGCVCKGKCTTNVCPCHSVGRECDPALCKSCQVGNDDERSCRNDSMIRKLSGKEIVVRKSNISGFGAFISEDAEGGGTALKGDFITEYMGQLISQDEAERRGCIYDEKRHTFLFNLNDHYVIDASLAGSKARFINSSAEANCDALPKLVNGDHRVGIYAKADIKKGEELTFNYTTVLKQYGMVKTPKTRKPRAKIGFRARKTDQIRKNK